MTKDTQFPCHSCGADLRFSPETGQMVCDFCGATEEIPETSGPWAASPQQEQDFRAALRNQARGMETEETRTAHCPNCAADVTFPPDVHATECPFCATPVVEDTGRHRHIKPRGLVPFQLDEAQARQEMTRWLGRLWFAPSGLQDYARKGRRLNGIYLPAWTYDAQTRSAYRGARGTEYRETRPVQRNGKTEMQTVTKVRWTPAAGRVARFFDDVLVIASHSLPEKFRSGLGQWPLKELSHYTPEFLAGFQAEAYQIDLEEGFTEARAQMDQQIRRDVKRDIGGDHQRIHAVQTEVSQITFKHILLPVWMAAYTYRGKSYRFAVNAATGEVVGERPWSAWKIAGAAMAAAIILGVGLYLLEKYQ